MSTRSTIKFIKKQDNKLIQLVNVYQQWDGYIAGVGHSLAKYLKSKKIINGISFGQETDDYANGFECLVAQFIRDFKTDVGGLYITDPDNVQEYNYEVIFDADKYYNMDFHTTLTADDVITIRVNNFFEGTPSELLKYQETYDDEEVI